MATVQPKIECTCRFIRAWIGYCGKPSAGGDRCAEHAKAKCVGCDKPASGECDFTGQFVCGAPLCDVCKPYTIRGESSGFCFMGHHHGVPPVSEAHDGKAD